MDTEILHSKRAITEAVWLTIAATLFFSIAFQLSKHGQFEPINPFANDPYDAVGSIAFQVALAGALIAAVRWARGLGELAFSARRGWLTTHALVVSLASIAVTLATDALGVALNPLTQGSVWETALVLLFVFVGVVAVAAGIATASSTRSLRLLPATPETSPNNTFADLFDDALVIADRLGEWLAARVPPVARPVKWGVGLGTRALGWLNRSWISPRAHAWRFCLACGLIFGAGLLTTELLVEGPPPSMGIAFLLTAIFLTAETVAVAAGYLLFGGWLGIRPPLRANRAHQ